MARGLPTSCMHIASCRLTAFVYVYTRARVFYKVRGISAPVYDYVKLEPGAPVHVAPTLMDRPGLHIHRNAPWQRHILLSTCSTWRHSFIDAYINVMLTVHGGCIHGSPSICIGNRCLVLKTSKHITKLNINTSYSPEKRQTISHNDIAQLHGKCNT